jgi:CD109 antigen
VVASKVVRPGQIYRVAVTIFETQTQTQEIEVRASILRNGVDMGSDTKICQPNTPETLMIRVRRRLTMMITPFSCASLHSLVKNG